MSDRMDPIDTRRPDTGRQSVRTSVRPFDDLILGLERDDTHDGTEYLVFETNTVVVDVCDNSRRDVISVREVFPQIEFWGHDCRPLFAGRLHIAKDFLPVLSAYHRTN